MREDNGVEKIKIHCIYGWNYQGINNKQMQGPCFLRLLIHSSTIILYLAVLNMNHSIPSLCQA